ncbi:MAG: plastocyanin/azurin family copper-binding protein, partial [Ginsengibacter sp.]
MKVKFTIKAILVLLIFLASLSLKTSATMHTVTVSNFQFSPSTIPNVVVGDIIEWVWQAGSFNHTTTCDPEVNAGTSLPTGAATWNSLITSGNTTFQYTVTVAGVYNYVCLPHAPGMAASFTASEPLPVKLSEFKISNENNSAVLKWTTLSEDNIDFFSIQKSKTGADFTEIAKVPAAGHSSIARSYNYRDPNLSSQDKYYYYTIASVDKEGKKEFSPVELFKNKINIS